MNIKRNIGLNPKKLIFNNLESEITIGQIFIGRPGGNDTALINGIEFNPLIRKDISLAIMEKYPNVEQVGFIDLSNSNKPKLQMAGGEFCGNATRLTAYLALRGEPGEIEIEISGVNQPLNAGVDQQGYAWVQMPIRSGNVNFLLEKRDGFSLVNLEGITQVVTQLDKQLTPQQLKKSAMVIIKKLGLDQSVPATGVMFLSETESGTSIEPVVWVRDIESLFYETACGSGTCAVGIVKAMEQKSNLDNYPVMQPSGLPIFVNISLDQDYQIKNVIIRGPILILN